MVSYSVYFLSSLKSVSVLKISNFAGWNWRPIHAIQCYSHLSNKRDFDKKLHPPRTFPPSTFIDTLYFFHPPLLVAVIYLLGFSKKIPPSTFIPTSTANREMRVHHQFPRKNKYLMSRFSLTYRKWVGMEKPLFNSASVSKCPSNDHTLTAYSELANLPLVFREHCHNIGTVELQNLIFLELLIWAQ